MIYINLYNLYFYLLIYVYYISCATHRSAMRELAPYKNCIIIISFSNTFGMVNISQRRYTHMYVRTYVRMYV